MPTKLTQLRLTDPELADLDKLQKRHKLPSRTAAVRLAIAMAMAATPAKIDTRTPKR